MIDLSVFEKNSGRPTSAVIAGIEVTGITFAPRFAQWLIAWRDKHGREPITLNDVVKGARRKRKRRCTRS